MDIKEQLSNLETQQKALQKAIDDLKNQIAIDTAKETYSYEIYKDGLLQPKNGKNYYYWESMRGAIHNSVNWAVDFDSPFINKGLVFLTEEKAKTHQKMLQAFSKCLTVQKFLNGDWVPDWNDSSQVKFRAFIEYGKIKYYTTSNVNKNESMFYFKDSESVKKFYEWCKPELITLGIIKE